MNNETKNQKNKKQKPILTEEELKKRKSKRTRVAAASFVLLLGMGILGNWYFENPKVAATIEPLISSSAERTKTLGEAEFVEATTELDQKENSYFASARVERQTARDEATDKLQSVLDKTDESEAARKKAAEEMAKLSENIANENKIETLVTAKGVDNCIAVIGTDGKKVDIIVDAEDLSDTLIVQIKDIAMSQLGCSFSDVTVIQSKE